VRTRSEVGATVVSVAREEGKLICIFLTIEQIGTGGSNKATLNPPKARERPAALSQSVRA